MPESLERGFKSEAERRALAIRRKLGFRARDQFEAQALAADLGIPVIPLTELRAEVRKPASISRALSSRAGFSALTICAGSRRLIVFNPSHPPGRRANSLTHELSHVLLKHKPGPAIGLGGCRHWNAQQEAEADWQAATLLVPRDGALWWMRHNGDIRLGAQHFGVSEALFRWRVNQTGVVRQLQAAAKKRRASFSDSVREGKGQIAQRSARRRLLPDGRQKRLPPQAPTSDSPSAATARARERAGKPRLP